MAVKTENESMVGDALAERRASIEQRLSFHEDTIAWLQKEADLADLKDLTESTDATVLTEESVGERVLTTHEDLKAYVSEFLPKAKTSLNAWLEEHHNGCPEKAQELFEYYQERPHLADFTLQTEMHRLDYTLVDPTNGSYIQNKRRIAAFFHQAACIRQKDMNILPRCANQSLLGDLLVAFMNTELEVHDDDCDQEENETTTVEETSVLNHQQHHQQQHHSYSLMPVQFQAFNKTRRVNFVIMPDGSGGGSILAKAALDLCLPHPTLDHLHIATIHTTAQFSPQQSVYDYKVESIQVFPPKEGELLETAYYLHDLPVPEESVSSRSRSTRSKDSSSSSSINLGELLMSGTQKLWNQLTTAEA